MYNRFLSKKLLEAIEDTPVILLVGARQTGKSTLIKEIIKNKSSIRYINLDDINVLSGAQADPKGFLEDLGENVALDEIQRAPELLIPIKESVDENRAPGRYLLTGSANIMTLPKVSESLAGRIEIQTLWPLSQGEIRRKPSTFLDHIFSENLPSYKFQALEREELSEILLKGGFPEVLERKSDHRREEWFKSYLNALIQRDIKNIANIDGLKELPRLLSFIASRSANLLNFSDLSRNANIPQSTLKRYFSLLESVFLIFLLPAWFPNKEKRLTKSPKIYLNDTGILCHLRHLDSESLKSQKTDTGAILENFVVLEILKQASWSKKSSKLYHYRDLSGKEVDLVLESSGQKVVGVEVKLSSSISEKDFQGIKSLKDTAKEKFLKGVVLYFGKEIIPFSKNMYAMPIQALWEI